MTDLASFYGALGRELGVAALAEEPLARHTTMRVGGPAAFLYLPETPGIAARLWHALRGGPLPVRVLGWGSNVIVADDGVRAAVIGTERLRRDPETVAEGRVLAWAGTPVPGLCRWAAAHGLAGLEFAEGIPAHLGGAIRMNAGANRSCFGEVTEMALVAGPGGTVVERALREADFGYRESFASREGLLVLGGRLRLRPDDPHAIRERMKRFRLRRRSTQPIRAHSAGCVFANYPGQAIGALVEALGLKGRRIGDAEVSPMHGNFIVNRGAARAADVLALIDEVRRELARATGEDPRLEVEIWRDEP